MIIDSIEIFLGKIGKKYFPKIYYTERIQKIWFELKKPSAIKFFIFLLIVLILIVIFSVFSLDDITYRLTGFARKQNTSF